MYVWSNVSVQIVKWCHLTEISMGIQSFLTSVLTKVICAILCVWFIGLTICFKLRSLFYIDICSFIINSTSQCRTAVLHCCKGDEASQREMAILGVSELRNRWTHRLKIWHTWLRRRSVLVCQISENLAAQGLAGNMVKCTPRVRFIFLQKISGKALPIKKNTQQFQDF